MLRRTFLHTAASAFAAATVMFGSGVKFHRSTLETKIVNWYDFLKFTPKHTKDNETFIVPLMYRSEEDFEELIISMHEVAKKQYPETKEFWTYTILNSDGRVGFITSNLELTEMILHEQK